MKAHCIPECWASQAALLGGTSFAAIYSSALNLFPHPYLPQVLQAHLPRARTFKQPSFQGCWKLIKAGMAGQVYYSMLYHLFRHSVVFCGHPKY